jgi:hypothetical protein
VNVPFQVQLRSAARHALGDRGRALIRRAELASGLRPRVNRRRAHTLAYPEGKRAAVVIVADLELGWAWRYARALNQLDLAREKAANGRRNLRVLLDLCDAYDVPITWAIVGHLFLSGCDRNGGVAHPELRRVRYFSNERWRYRSGDWFDCDPGLRRQDSAEWPVWYAPDLVQAILDRPTQHEIGSHSFSHIPFEPAACPAEAASGELQLCRELAARWGIALRSFVYPGNIRGHLASLAAAGFTSYRSIGFWELDLPRRDALGLWAVPAGLCLDRAYQCWSAEEHFESVRRYIDVAIETGLLCSFWFHPEVNASEVDQLFPRLFDYLQGRRDELWITTISDLSRWLEQQ